MRAFIAVDLPGTVVKSLAGLQKLLEKADADVSWVRPRSMHLTLKFLGEVDDRQLALLKDVLPAVCAEHLRFDIAVEKLGAFPDPASPRIVWAGIGANADKLAALAADIEKTLAGRGFAAEERPFAGHITLGRVRGNRNRRQLSEVLKNTADQPQKMQLVLPVDSLTLTKSTLTSGGPLYQPLATISLKTA